jgi:uncharacterized SAM-binding protein YcdF (DUF218 family)
VIRDIARLLAAASLGALLVGGYTTYRILAQGDRDDRRPADAIVVLGAAQYDGRPSPVFQARLAHAVALYHDGLAPYLLVTGGKAVGDRTTEAAAARAYALAEGVPSSAILVEDRSRTTLESLRGVAALMRERDLRSGLFVSDRTHMLRVLRIARDEGLAAWGSPTRSSPIDADPARRTRATLREVAALAAYFVGGRAGGDAP